jgi:hypothetical protein
MKCLVMLSVLLSASVLRADDAGGVALFNGKDLSNWVNVNCAPETWTAADGVIKCTGKPTGALRTPRQYENFVLELDWRHMKAGGNAGVFVWASAITAPGVPFLRAIEVQVLDNAFHIPGKNEWYTTHGDVFPIHGATMKPIHKGNGMRCFPIEERSKPSPEWNHYRIVGQDGKLRLSVNGKEVSGGDECNWRKGYLGLESEGSPTEWRNIRIQELPGHEATPDQSAPKDDGWRPLYNGVDLRGWKVNEKLKAQWIPADWRLKCKAGGEPLFLAQERGACDLIIDVKTPKNSVVKPFTFTASVIANKGQQFKATIRDSLVVAPGQWRRSFVTLRKSSTAIAIQTPRRKLADLGQGQPFQQIGLSGSPTEAVEFGNIYIRELK